MDERTAKALVGNYWRNGDKDSRLDTALAALGISVGELARLERETRKVERGMGPLLLTPTGCGKRNR